MAKPKSPLLSLGARGTIGDALTFQKSGTDHIVRQKPIPTDPYSLKQAYQRWDYRDYAYLWTLLSNSEKQIYRTKASNYHITGFSQWMREKLNTLPDLAGRWHLDEKAGAIAYDSSKNHNHATIIGASPATGLIAGAFSFDGLNDRILFGNPPSLTNMTQKSLSLFFKPGPFTGVVRYLYIGSYWIGTYGDYIRLDANANLLHIRSKNTAGFVADKPIPFTPDSWSYLAYSWDATTIHYFLNDQELLPALPFTGTLACASRAIELGSDNEMQWYDGLIDQFKVYNRPLDATEHKRHSQRRYPV